MILVLVIVLSMVGGVIVLVAVIEAQKPAARRPVPKPHKAVAVKAMPGLDYLERLWRAEDDITRTVRDAEAEILAVIEQNAWPS